MHALFKPKASVALIGVIAALLAAAAPATASWKSKSTQSHGQAKATGELLFWGGSLNETSCPKEEVKAQWYIQAKGQIKQQQKAAIEGPNLNVQVKSWGAQCKTRWGTALSEKREPAQLKACNFQLRQEAGSNTATVGMLTTCVIKIGPTQEPKCIEQLPAGMETKPESNEGNNVGLKSAALSDEGQNGNLLTKFGLLGILAYSEGASCPLASSSTSAEIPHWSFEGEGVEEV